jgi:mannose-1-phosphate guanylyltransferase
MRRFGIVLAAGRGTRLAPLTDRLPKPAVPVRGVPLAAYALRRLAAAGIRRVGLNVFHLADAVGPALEGFVPPGMEVSLHREPELLGTGGGVRFVAEALGVGLEDTVVVVNGDILSDPPIEQALAEHASRGALGTLVLTEAPGAVEIDGDGVVRRLLGAPAKVPGTLRRHGFIGAQVLSGRALLDLPVKGGILRGGAYRRWVDAGGDGTASVVYGGPFADLGTPAAYLAACLEGGDHLDPTARVGDGAVLEEVVLEAGAEVDAGARLRRVVVWPGARAEGEVSDAIVLPDGIVSVA